MPFMGESSCEGYLKFIYTCNNCKKSLETPYRCSVCFDFDLCVECYEKKGHLHKMEKLGLDTFNLNQEILPFKTETNKLSLERCLDVLRYASQCCEPDCELKRCQMMRRMVIHTKVCKKKYRKDDTHCNLCKHLITLCYHHTKYCHEIACPVPFCSIIKQKSRQRSQPRLQEENNRAFTSNAESVASTATAANTQFPRQLNSQISSNILQDTLPQEHQEVIRAQASSTNYNGVTPNAPAIPVTTGCHSSSDQGNNNMFLTNHWQMYPNQEMRQPFQDIVQYQNHLPVQISGATFLPSTANITRTPNPAHSHTFRPVLQQLLLLLRSPPTLEQQQRVQAILKAHPQLKTAFMRYIPPASTCLLNRAKHGIM